MQESFSSWIISYTGPKYEEQPAWDCFPVYLNYNLTGSVLNTGLECKFPMHSLYNKDGMGIFWSGNLATYSCVTLGCGIQKEGLLNVNDTTSDVIRVRLNKNYPVSYSLFVH